jgi:Sec-independent protein translocase protein TatA
VNFLNVGPWELSVILIIAILLIGPKRLVEVFQAIRRLSGQLRRMSTEFTSLIQSEIQTSARETDQAPSGPDGEVEDTIQSGLSPLASIQTELQTAAQETRQALENIVKEELGPVADIQTELQTAAQETRQALEDTVQDTRGLIADTEAELPITSEPKSSAGQDEASDKDPTN